MLILSKSIKELNQILAKIKYFLNSELLLDLHPKKVVFRPYHQGIDFLGTILLPSHTVLRNKTKRRMLKKLAKKAYELDLGLCSKEQYEQVLKSYLGLISHQNHYKLSAYLVNNYYGL
jgi:hypothetical protein